MNSHTTSSLDKLTRGECLPREDFLALLADPSARDELTRLGLVRDLLKPPDEPPPFGPSAAGVTVGEIERYLDGRLDDDARRAAVERFLREHDPDMLPAESEQTTHVEWVETETTVIEPSAEGGPPEPPAGGEPTESGRGGP